MSTPLWLIKSKPRMVRWVLPKWSNDAGRLVNLYTVTFTSSLYARSTGLNYWDEWTIRFYARKPMAAARTILEAVNNGGYFNDYALEEIN